MQSLSSAQPTRALSRLRRALPLITLLALGAGLLCSGQAQAQSYQVQSLSQNGAFTFALNARGQVSGSLLDNNGTYQAFLSGPDGQSLVAMTQLPGDATGNAINFSGQIAGDVITGRNPTRVEAFVTGAQGQNAILLGGIGGNLTTARGINDSGTVIGMGRDGSGSTKFHALRWQANSTEAERLLTLGGNTSSAQAINGSGLIVGNSGLSDGSLHAVIWGLNGAAITDLGTLGGLNSSALAINQSAQVAGTSRVADGSLRAFITGAGAQGMSDLGTLGWVHSQASFINNAGVVVGNLFNGSDGDSYFAGHAFITGANGQGMVDLNSLVSLGEGLYLNDVWGLNDAGQVLVSDQNGLAYLLTPVPEASTSAMLLAGLLVLALLTHQRRRSAASLKPALA
ncbi:hypothetical protein LNV23_03660 [Paucibacter sp. DJ1R-11]|uniref:hypothetical protein n=1 Tax=Paucibacter sp. DJ1R-11 TaxID=2893556 RepID=UPI0021E3F72D|nr:hypothetical protein [Paucibacter sp. DJ1R-11]MCV2362543.1 hypothetical protein [Paucibacter sp. DJ1R-11]